MLLGNLYWNSSSIPICFWNRIIMICGFSMFAGSKTCIKGFPLWEVWDASFPQGKMEIQRMVMLCLKIQDLEGQKSKSTIYACKCCVLPSHLTPNSIFLCVSSIFACQHKDRGFRFRTLSLHSKPCRWDPLVILAFSGPHTDQYL